MGGGGLGLGHKLKAWLQSWQENRKLRGRRDGREWGRGGRGWRDLRPWLKAAVQRAGVKALCAFKGLRKTDLSTATRGSAKTSTLANLADGSTVNHICTSCVSELDLKTVFSRLLQPGSCVFVALALVSIITYNWWDRIHDHTDRLNTNKHLHWLIHLKVKLKVTANVRSNNFHFLIF